MENKQELNLSKTNVSCSIHNSNKYLCSDCTSIQILKSKIRLETLKRKVSSLQDTIDHVLDKSISITKIERDPEIETKHDLIEQTTKPYHEGIDILQQRMILLKLNNKKKDIDGLKLKIKAAELQIVDKMQKKDAMFKSNIDLSLLMSPESDSVSLKRGTNEVTTKIHETNDKLLVFSSILSKQKYNKYIELKNWVNITYINRLDSYYMNDLVPIPKDLKTSSTMNFNSAPWNNINEKNVFTNSSFLIENLEKIVKLGTRILLERCRYENPDIYNFTFKLNKSQKQSTPYEILITKLTFIIFGCLKLLDYKKQLHPLDLDFNDHNEKTTLSSNSWKDLQKIFSGTNFLGKLLYATFQVGETLDGGKGTLSLSSSSLYNTEHIGIPQKFYEMGDFELITTLHSILNKIVETNPDEEKWMLVK